MTERTDQPRPSAMPAHLVSTGSATWSTIGDAWRPGIGDPTAAGWITVCAYFLAAGLCLRATRGRADCGSSGRRVVVAWRALALMMLLLGVNKQLDIQSLLTSIAKDSAKRGGWYEDRRTVQVWFIRGLLSAGLVALVGGAWWVRGHVRELWLAGVGTVSISTFVLVRALSFHKFDAFLLSGPGGLRMNWVLELGGVACVALAAWGQRRRALRSRPSSRQRELR